VAAGTRIERVFGERQSPCRWGSPGAASR